MKSHLQSSFATSHIALIFLATAWTGVAVQGADPLVTSSEIVTTVPTVRVVEQGPPVLTRSDAAKLLIHMDYSRVEIVAVVSGVHTKGVAAISCSTVIALARREGKDCEIVQSFFYDRELGWFYYEFENARARIWTITGYRELKITPFSATPLNPVPAQLAP